MPRKKAKVSKQNTQANTRAVVMAALEGAYISPPDPTSFPLITPSHQKHPPEKLEWFLWGSDVKTDQLKNCVIYEYARTTPWIRDFFGRCKQGEQPPAGAKWGFRNDGAWFFESSTDSAFDGLTIELPAGFPDEPYSQTKRARAILRRTRTLGELDEPLMEVTPQDVIEFCKDPMEGDVGVCFWLRWKTRNEDICASFARWLAKYRKEHPMLKPLKKQQDAPDLLQGMLFNLGIFRLLTFYNYTVAEAGAFLKLHGQQKEQKNLYRSYELAAWHLEQNFDSGPIPQLKEILSVRRQERKSRQSAPRSLRSKRSKV